MPAGCDAGSRDALWNDILQYCDARICEWIAQFCADAAIFAQSNAKSDVGEPSFQMLRSAVRAVYDASVQRAEVSDSPQSA